MTYEISPNHTYTLRYSIKSKAKSDHLMVYPIGYQWSGSGDTSVPKLASKNQYLLTMLKSGNKNKTLTPAPYKVTMSTEKDWHYSFVALNPPVHKNETVEIKYSQNFVDKHATARPYLGYITRVTMQRLELNVKFAPNALPQKVECYYIKPSDPGRPYFTTGVQYDSDKEWATWVVENPKKGYCYRIQWY